MSLNLAVAAGSSIEGGRRGGVEVRVHQASVGALLAHIIVAAFFVCQIHEHKKQDNEKENGFLSGSLTPLPRECLSC